MGTYMKTNIYLYLSRFLQRQISRTKVVEKIKTNILISITFFFRKSCSLSDNVEKYSRSGLATNDYSACAFHAGYLRLQTHTQNM